MWGYVLVGALVVQIVIETRYRFPKTELRNTGFTDWNTGSCAGGEYDTDDEGVFGSWGTLHNQDSEYGAADSGVPGSERGEAEKVKIDLV